MAAAGLLASAAAASAQGTTLWVDAAAAYSRPPGAGPTDAVDFGTASLSLRSAGSGPITFDGLAYGGASFDAAAGWLGGSLALDATRRAGRVRLGGRVEASGLHYFDPFLYTAAYVSVAPRVGWALGSWDLSLHGELTRGRWRGEVAAGPVILPLPGPTAPAATVDGDLAVSGGGFAARRRIADGAVLRFAAAAYDAENGEAPGAYAGLDGGVDWARGRFRVGVGASLWSVPGVGTGREVDSGFDADARVALTTDLAAHAGVSRSVRDPLYGAEGVVGATVGVTWSAPLSRARAPRPVAEIGPPAAGGRTVRFRLRAHASTVELAGDFNGWRPQAMARERDDIWTLDLVVPPGLHHFAFHLDGERWMVPADAPGIGDDGWGRRTASIVVEEGA